MDGTGNILILSNLTVSGTLQSPMTSLFGVSSGIIDGKIAILGGSDSNRLSRNEIVIPTSFTTWGSTGRTD